LRTSFGYLTVLNYLITTLERDCKNLRCRDKREDRSPRTAPSALSATRMDGPSMRNKQAATTNKTADIATAVT
jgi:hypothetical protein